MGGQHSRDVVNMPAVAISDRQRLTMLADVHRGGADPNACEADGGECSICAVLDCPEGEPLHYHHDGCPACSFSDPGQQGE